MAALGQAGPLARLSDLLQRPAGSLSEGLGRLLGGVDPAEIRKRLGQAGALSDAELAAKGITDRDRIAAMSEQVMRSAGVFEAVKKETDPTKRSQMLEGAKADIDALTRGGDAAKARIAAILKARGMDPAQIDAVLRNNLGNFSQEDRERLQALRLAQTKGLLQSQAGLAPDALVATRHVDAAHDAFVRMNSALDTNSTDKAAATAAALDSARTVGEGLILDQESMKSLGEGGLSLVRGLHDKRMALAALAKKKGMTVEQLLGSGDSEARRLSGAIQKDLDEVKRRRAPDAKVKAMGSAELAAAKDYREKLTASDEIQNRQAIDALADATGGRALSEDERKELAQRLGSGEDAAVARQRLQQQLEARKSLDEIAAAHKWDARMLRRAAVEGKLGNFTSGLAPEERKKLEDAAAGAGSVLRAGDEGVTARGYADSLKDLASVPAAAPGAAAKPKDTSTPPAPATSLTRPARWARWRWC